MTNNPHQVKLVNADLEARAQYRLGDAVLLRGHSAGRSALANVMENADGFRQSILYRYATKADPLDPGPQWPILSEVVRSHSSQMNIPMPEKDELVIHLRMGDIRGFKGTEAAFVEFVRKAAHEWKAPISRITIVTAIHYGKSVLRNRLTAEQLSQEIEQEIRKVTNIVDLLSVHIPSVRIFSHDDVDTDFCYLANASNLIIGNGNFSLCAAMISRAEVVVPPWVESGGLVDARECLVSRDPIPEKSQIEKSSESASPGGPPTAAILCIARNEHPFIDEWLEYHFKLGFDRIYFVSTDDDFPSVINHMSSNNDLSKIELFHFGSFTRNWQISCYNKFLPFVTEDWLMVLDLDEFVCLGKQGNIKEYLGSIDPLVGQVQFPWLMQVSNQYFHHSVSELVADGTFHASDHVKSLVRRRAVSSLGIHAHRCAGENILSSGQAVSPASRQSRFLTDTTYTQENPFVLHLSSRGILDTLIRILGHRFFNEKNDERESRRTFQFINGNASWENIPNRFLLGKIHEKLPEVEKPGITMPELNSVTNTGSLMELFFTHIEQVVASSKSLVGDSNVELEKKFQVMHKLSALDVSDSFSLDEYKKCTTQIKYARKLRRALVA